MNVITVIILNPHGKAENVFMISLIAIIAELVRYESVNGQGKSKCQRHAQKVDGGKGFVEVKVAKNAFEVIGRYS